VGRSLRAFAPVAGRHLIADDVVAQVDALVADEDRRAGDQLLHLVLALAAEGAVKGFFAGEPFFSAMGQCLVTESCRDDNQIKNGVFPQGKRRRVRTEVQARLSITWSIRP
jgi:hypothetical protein